MRKNKRMPTRKRKPSYAMDINETPPVAMNIDVTPPNSRAMNIDVTPPNSRAMNIDVTPPPKIQSRRRRQSRRKDVKRRPTRRRRRQQSQQRKRRDHRIASRRRRQSAPSLQLSNQDFLNTMTLLVGPDPAIDIYGQLLTAGSIVATHVASGIPTVFIKAYNSPEDFLLNRPTPVWAWMLEHSSLQHPIGGTYTLFRYNIPRRIPSMRSRPVRLVPSPMPSPPRRAAAATLLPQQQPPQQQPPQQQPPQQQPPQQQPPQQQPQQPRLPTQVFQVRDPEDLMDPLLVERVVTGSVLVYFLDAAGRAHEDQYIVAFRFLQDRATNTPTPMWADLQQRRLSPFTGEVLNMDRLEYRVARVEQRPPTAPQLATCDFPEGTHDGFSFELAEGNILVYFADARGKTFLTQSIVGYESMQDYLENRPTDSMRYVLEKSQHPFLRKNMTIEAMNLMFCKVHLVKSETPTNGFVTAVGSPATPLSAFVTANRPSPRTRRANAAMARLLKAKQITKQTSTKLA